MNAFVPISAQRAGIAVCVCLPAEDAGRRTPASRREVALLGTGAAASVLSQALMFSLLPLVGGMLAPERGLAGIPFIALFVGAIVATFPASILVDAFSRRAAFALGASLGIAGGFVIAWALVFAAFWPLVLGAFWIGIANGFALQYRHAAATGGEGAGTVAIVIGAGALIGLIAPSLAALFELSLTPVVGAGTAALAAAAHVFALGAAVALPSTNRQMPAPAPVAAAFSGRWLGPTAVAALAWFAMMAVMAFAPLGLAGCGVAFTGTVGVVAWHLVAMYAPALALGFLVERLGLARLGAGGLALMTLAVLGLATGTTASTMVAALIVAGAGWSLATSAGLIALHRTAPSRLAIAAHDACILLAGVGGALVSGRLFA